MLTWSNDGLAQCYHGLQHHAIDDGLALQTVRDDLNSLLVVPAKTDAAKQQLIDNNSPIQFSSGDKFQLNAQFIEGSVLLSNELGLNELVCLEVLYYANQDSVEDGISFVDSGKQAFFKRYQYILNILGYLITNHKLELVVTDFGALQSNLIKSFGAIYSILNNVNDLVNKQVITNTNSEVVVNSVQYTKMQLFECHELLGQIYFNLVHHYPQHFGSTALFRDVLAHMSGAVTDNDALVLHYLPGLLCFVNNLSKLPEADVIALHKQITAKLAQDFAAVSGNVIDLSKSTVKQYEILVDFMFMTNFIPWCKATGNITKFNFNDDILAYIQICLNYGVLENLLRLTSESAHTKTHTLFELNHVCDFRSYLQRTFPGLTFEKFNYTEGLAKFNTTFTLSPTFKEDLLPYFWHSFFINFIGHVAIVLTKLRDSEEDYLLSSINRIQKRNNKPEDSRQIGMADDKVNLGLTKASNPTTDTDPSLDLDLDEIYSRADLERFYLSFVYTYKFRDDICGLLWEDDDINNDLIGFIMWGVNNNSSPLITATFCLLLSSLTSRNNRNGATTKIFESLINNNSNLKKTDYTKISIDSIIDSLNYYLNALNENFESDLNSQIKQRQKRQEFLFSNGSANENPHQITIELAEDSVIFISGFVLLISSLVGNLGADERSKDIRANLFNRFKPIVVGFLKFDNLIINLQNTKTSEAMISINDSNRSILINLMLQLLVSFNLAELKYEIWEILDKWMFHSLIENDLFGGASGAAGAAPSRDYFPGNPVPGVGAGASSSTGPGAGAGAKVKLVKNTVSIKNAFKFNLLNLSNISNFTELLASLLTPVAPKLKLPYPINLGYNYRLNNQVGIWPYMEFMVLDVLSNSNKVVGRDMRLKLQTNLVDMVLKSLTEVDWKFLTELLPNISDKFNMLSLVEDLPYESFIKLHHSVAVLNYLLDEKAYKAIFEIIGAGESDELVLNGLIIVDKMLTLQEIFRQLIPVLKNGPSSSTSGASSGTSSSGGKLLAHTSSTNSLLITPNLTIYYPSNFNLVDFYDVLSTNIPFIIKLGLLIESSDPIVDLAVALLTKINHTFSHARQQDLFKNKLLTIFLASEEANLLKYGFINSFTTGSITTKLTLLRFLISDLDKCNDIPCCCHYLLGYEIKGSYLLLDSSQNTLLKNLVLLLMASLPAISATDYNTGINTIDPDYIQVTSLILKVIVKLFEQPISSAITLDYLREFDLEENLFERLLKCQPKIDTDTVWFHHSFNGDLALANEFIYHKPSLVTFFDFFRSRVLIIQYLTLEFHSLAQKGSIYKRNQYLRKLMSDDQFLNDSNKILDFLDILNFNFHRFEKFNYQKFSSNLNVLLPEVYDETAVYRDEVLTKLVDIYGPDEVNSLKDYLVKYIVSGDLKQLQLNYLHCWVQLIEVIINDGNLPKQDYQNFILEVLSSILPKINDYFESDIIFSEELISLCVILFDYYEQDEVFIERLISLFSTCIKGVISSNSTIALRNDLYIIMNNFLQKSFSNQNLLKKLIVMLEKIDLKFLEIICNDSVINEGSIRVISIILLESIIHLFNHFDNKYVLSQLIHNNSLLLIIRSLKRIDEILYDDEKNISTILYELINFKSIINLLIRIGQVRDGGSYLIQSELFSIIKQLKFLMVDPELGINIKIDELNDINLSLDSNLNFINYYEFLLPVFKLISILLISMGPNYKPSKIQGQNLLVHFNDLKNSIIKKDILINENNGKYKYEQELELLMNQFILIEGLVE